jgi:hypothetical protein
MTMHPYWIVLLPVLATGCVAPQAVRVSPPASLAPPVAVAAVAPTTLVETRYEVRGYRETAAPDLRHEPHAVFRRTRVPVLAQDESGTVPRVTAPALSDAPLPVSAELAAELATQKTVTAEIRALQLSMVEAERRMQAQYALLVRQSAEVMKVREQLEAERQRVHGASPAITTAVAPAPAGTDPLPEVKW